MGKSVDRRALGVAVAVSFMALGPAGCGGPPDEQEQPTVSSDPDAPAGISVSEGRLMLPAVAGNPGAVYFTIRNDGAGDQAIRSVSVNGAGMAMLHETRMEGGTARMGEAGEVEVHAGETIAFAPGGLHVMAMDIGDTLEAGGQTEVTLTFASGDKVSFPAEIHAPGDAGAAE